MRRLNGLLDTFKLEKNLYQYIKAFVFFMDDQAWLHSCALLTNVGNLSGLSFIYDKLMNAPDMLNSRENMTSCVPIWCKMPPLETHFTSRISCKGTEGQKPSRPSEWQYRRNVCNLTDYKLFSGLLQCFDPSPVLFVLSLFEATSDLGRSNLCVFCVQLQSSKVQCDISPSRP